MSGTSNSVKTVTASGNDFIDGVLTAAAWADDTVYYAFSLTNSRYDYFDDVTANFQLISNQQKVAVNFALDVDSGPSASAGFSIEGFTDINIESRGDADSDIAEIRIAQSSSFNVPTAQVADFPSNALTTGINDDNGDVWFGTQTNYRNPVAGNFAWVTHLHELGHAMGLSHGHQPFELGVALPTQWDTMEYSIMTYRSYVGGDSSYSNAPLNWAQTYMMADIAALQYMYGADFSTNSGDTVYKWNPGSGDTLVNGEVGIDGGSNMIFATLWDGGGIDTYDLSAYNTNLVIDLTAGSYLLFDNTQLADLGHGNFARANIYNALMFDNDTRSLIENIRGGSGFDQLFGNLLSNTIHGNDGDDTLTGGKGNDRLFGGSGIDWLKGEQGNDKLRGGGGDDLLEGQSGKDLLKGGGGHDSLYGGKALDRLFGQGGEDTLIAGSGNDVLKGGNGDDIFYGQGGRDTISGQNGDDYIFGGKGNDRISGGAGAEVFAYSHGVNEGNDTITDFQDGVDRIRVIDGSFTALTISQTGSNTNIHNTDGTDILLIGVNSSLITEADFDFF